MLVGEPGRLRVELLSFHIYQEKEHLLAKATETEQNMFEYSQR